MNKDYLSIFESIDKNGGKFKRRNKNDKILIVDGLNTFIRVFSAIPTTNENGIHIGGIVGFLKSVGYAIKMVRPTRCIIVFDGLGGSARRRKLYPDYKSKRNPKHRLNRIPGCFSSKEEEHKSMQFQFNRVVDYLKLLPVTIISIDHIEADDTIAYISKQLFSKSEIVIMSTDKDFIQLVSDRIKIWSPTKKIMYDKKKVLEDFEIPSHNFIMSKIIRGDASDNIVGINGVGRKTILKKLPLLLENEIITIERLFKDIDKLDDKSLATKNLKENKAVLELNYKLMQLDEVNISASAKLKINELVSEKIKILSKPAFRLLFSEDKLWNTLPNLDSWLLQTYETLNAYAGKK